MATKTTTKKAKQSSLDITGPGVSPVSITEVDEAADVYVDIRDKRVRMTAKEVTAKGNLIDLLHANADKIGRDGQGTIRYEHDGRVILLQSKGEKLSVKELTDKQDEEP